MAHTDRCTVDHAACCTQHPSALSSAQRQQALTFARDILLPHMKSEGEKQQFVASGFDIPETEKTVDDRQKHL
jgi:hypothetical protein